MTIVYRIETPDGRGMCEATGSKICTVYKQQCHDECEHCLFRHLPLTHEEIRHRYLAMQDPHFAFPSLAALATWFPQAQGRKLMLEAGATLNVYQTNAPVIADDYQALFDKTTAIRLATNVNLETLEARP